MQPDVAPCLKTLTIKELIGPHEGTLIGEEAFKFLHALIRDAAYSGVLKRTRAELHVAFVDWVESAAGDRILEYEEIRGFHLEQAYEIRSELGVQDEEVVTLGRRAASYLSSAGRRALNRGDLPAADNLLRRAAATLPHGDPFAVELLVEAGEALVDLGELAQADDVLGSAIDQATARGDGSPRWVRGSFVCGCTTRRRERTLTGRCCRAWKPPSASSKPSAITWG